MTEERDQDRIPVRPPTIPGFRPEGPRRVMLMTPQMIVIGGALAFLSVLLFVVVLPTSTFGAGPSDNWLPLSDEALAGRSVFLSNGCVYCHSGFSRPQDVFQARLYLYPRASEPGDFYSSSESPNILGSQRTGPDLSQEGGNHPQDWHEAHYANPRFVMPLSIMPQFSFLSDEDVQHLLAFNQSQGGKEAVLRTSAISVGDRLMTLNGGGIAADEAFPNLVAQLRQSGEFVDGGKGSDTSPWGLPWGVVWHMNSFERTYLLTNNPLPITQQNLMRGREVYQARCVGCHGEQGDGKGPAADYLKPGPFDFTDDAALFGPKASDGMMYHRILTAGPGTAMENFGTRLTVDDVWRTVMFLRTIPFGGLDQVPTTDLYQQWTPPQPFINYVDAHPLTDQPPLTVDDPFMAAALWVAPGLREGDDAILVGGQLPMTLWRLRDLIEQEYYQRVEGAYADAQARGDELPPLDELRDMHGVVWHAP